MDKYKVRFHLASGKNFKKWQVTYPSGAKRYYEPNDVVLLMKGCFLRHQKTAAEKIYNRETTKVVCAWVECESVEVIKDNQWTMVNTPVVFNPHENPNWLVGGQVANNTNLDLIQSDRRHLNTLK
jgi:hypothetical protein